MLGIKIQLRTSFSARKHSFKFCVGQSDCKLEPLPIIALCHEQPFRTKNRGIFAPPHPWSFIDPVIMIPEIRS